MISVWSKVSDRRSHAGVLGNGQQALLGDGVKEPAVPHRELATARQADICGFVLEGSMN
jgi:hypothetical protein